MPRGLMTLPRGVVALPRGLTMLLRGVVALPRGVVTFDLVTFFDAVGIDFFVATLGVSFFDMTSLLVGVSGESSGSASRGGRDSRTC